MGVDEGQILAVLASKAGCVGCEHSAFGSSANSTSRLAGMR
jgi:hypothetical protein